MESLSPTHFLLREPDELSHRASGIVWNDALQALVLAQNQTIRLPESSPSSALDAWQTATALVVDNFRQQARIANSGTLLEYNAGRGFLPLHDGDLNIVDAPEGRFLDIALGGDGRIAAIYSNETDQHGVLVFHLGKRWQVATSLPQQAQRVAVDANNKVWCFSDTQIFCCEGEPLPHRYESSPVEFEPSRVNPHPLRIVQQQDLSAGDIPLALSTYQQQLAILAHDGEGRQSLLVRNTQLSIPEWRRYLVDSNVPFATDLAWLSSQRLAILAPQNLSDPDFAQRDCPIVDLRWESNTLRGEAQLRRERYPMLSQASPRFAMHMGDAPLYQGLADGEVAQAGFEVHPRKLQALRRPHYLNAAAATLNQTLDSGTPNTTWHRIYLEGSIPPGCKIVLYAKTFNNPEQRTRTPFIRQQNWHWCQHRSERAFGKGLVEAKAGEAGLFELLLQRKGGPVRRLNGRYCQLRIQFESDGKHTPCLHALKIVFPRESYQEQLLPEHFHQEHAVDPSLDDESANGADVRERMLAAFEAVLGPIENQIASAEVLISPEYTPVQHLPWLAEALGQQLPTHWPEQRQRRWLIRSGELQRWRGTVKGLRLALDIATDGAVECGQVVVVENFRLRRTMATILGLDMDDSEHPLTLGTGVSGNSRVGESLILSDAQNREFLALFAPELASSNSDKQAVEAFFDRYAHRICILLHGSAKHLRHQVEACLQEQLPVHLHWQIIESDLPFVLGLSPLLGVDTFIEQRPAPHPVILNDTYLSREGVLRNPIALSPRDANLAKSANFGEQP